MVIYALRKRNLSILNLTTMGDWEVTERNARVCGVGIFAATLVVALVCASPARSQGVAADQWAEAYTEWKDLLAKLREILGKNENAEEEELPALQKEYDETVEKARNMVPRLRELATAAYLESPNEDRELTRWLVKLVDDDIRREDYDAAAKLSKLLMDHECVEREVYNQAGIASFAIHDFKAAREYLEQAESNDSLEGNGEKFLAAVDEYIEFWEKEQELRKQEAKAGDLPRVKLTTSKGDIVIELFENEAPQTVGNFVSLVEKAFYDGLTFHRVLPGFMAQGGCPTGDGSGGPGYEIPCECYKENYRKHFRGSLSMAHAGRDTGGSQFFLTFVPTPHLNGKHTVFGRVIEGMDVLGKLQRRDPNAPGPKPDTIRKATVLHKREHKYVPTKVD